MDFNDAICHLRFLFLGENEDTVNGCKDAGDSNDSGDDPPISLGGSVSDGDIVDESDEEDGSDGEVGNRMMKPGKWDHNF